MQVLCKDLPSLPSFRQIELVAGRSGLNRQVRWPYVTLTYSIDKWVQGGELMFVSGVGYEQDEAVLVGLLQESIQKHLAGMVILVGQEYIREIPPRLITLADQADLPLFRMPYSVPLVLPTEEISSLIIKNQMEDRFFSKLMMAFSQGTAAMKTLWPRRLRFINSIFPPASGSRGCSAVAAGQAGSGRRRFTAGTPASGGRCAETAWLPSADDNGRRLDQLPVSLPLGRLEDADAQGGTHYVQTLEIYLEENCNAVHAAQRLFLHRNSLNYRIRKIEAILGCDLSSNKERLKLRDAFLLRSFLRIAE